MFKEYPKIVSLIGKDFNSKFILVSILLSISAIFEIIGVSSAIPFISIMLSPENLLNNPYILKMNSLLNIEIKYTFLALGGLSLSLMLFANGLTLLANYFACAFTFDLGTNLSSKIFENYLKRDYEYHITRSSSSMISLLTDQTTRFTHGVLLPFLNCLSRYFVLLLVLGLMIYINFLLTLIFVGFFSLFYAIGYLSIKKRAISIDESLSISYRKRLSIIQESLLGIKEIIIKNNFKFFENLFNKNNEIYFKAHRAFHILALFPKYYLEFLAFVFILIVATLSYYKIVVISGPELLFYFVAAYKIMPALQVITNAQTTIKSNLGALSELYDELSGVRISEKNLIIQESLKISFEKNLELRSIGYSYPRSPHEALKNISLKIPKNTSIGIAGRSGMGKSTLVDVLIGLLVPTQGQLFVDGVEINDSNISEWRRKIAYVPQSIFLLDGSILENITFGDMSEVNYALVEKALKLSCLKEYVDSLADGVNAQAGERGICLSGGQRQRIGIARAIYLGAEILILDEATSALDPYTEGEIMESIKMLQGSLTIVLITHKENVLKNLNQIVVLKDAQILLNGDYVSLIKNEEVYRSVFIN